MTVTLTAAESAINRTTRRYVEASGPRTWTLWTFERPSDETYNLVGSDYTKSEAQAWLNGADVLDLLADRSRHAAARVRRSDRDATATFSFRERQALRTHIAQTPTQHDGTLTTAFAKLRAALGSD